MTDVWDGFASLLAELIEKHAAELPFDEMPVICDTDSYEKGRINTELHIDKINSA